MAPPPFDRLLEYRPFVRALARRLATDDALADDLEQQAWLIVLDRPPRHDRALNAWFSRLLKNVWLNTVTSERRRAYRERTASADRASAFAPPMDEGWHEVLVAALNALPAPRAEVVRLRFFEGLSAHETARRLGVPVETVRSRLRRALGQMRERLDRSYGERDRWGRALLAWAALRGPGVPQTALVAGLVLAVGAAASLVGSLVSTGPEEVVAALTAPPEVRELARAVQASSPGTDTRVAAESTGAAALLVDARWADGTPARGLGVWLEPADAVHELASPDARTAVLDAEGRVAWDDLDPGAWRLYSTIGRSESLALRAEETLEVAWELGRSHPLRLEVIPYDELSARGAEVYVSLPGDVERLVRVGEVDATGALELPDFDPRSWVVARLERRLSSVVSLDHPRLRNDPFPRLELPLERSRPLLEVTVLDEEGAPVPGARVRLGNARRFPARRGADGFLRIVPVWNAVTDAAGHCTMQSTCRGRSDLEVTGGGLAPWSGRVGLGDRGATVRLMPAARVAGTVRDDAGVPVARAAVCWSWRGHRRSVVTDADGAYALPPLAEGPLELQVVAERGEGTLVASTRIDLAVGERADWSPRLARAPVLEGRALDADGTPLAGTWVALLATLPEDPIAALVVDDASLRWAAVDDEGVFRFAELDPPEAAQGRALCLYARRELGVPLGWLDEVPYAARTLRLGPCATGRADAALVVRQAPGPGGRPAPEVFLTSPGSPVALRGRPGCTARTWTFEGLPPGEWSVLRWSADTPPVVVAQVQLRSGATDELEIGAPAPPGRLEVRTVDAAGLALAPRSVDLIRLDGPPLRLHASVLRGCEHVSIAPDGLVSASAPPGEYLVLLHRADTVDESRRVTIASGESRRIEVALLPGVPRTLTFDLVADEDARSRELWLEFRTPAGERRLEGIWSIRSSVSVCTVELRVPDEPLDLRARILRDGTEVRTVLPQMDAAPEPVALAD